MRVIARREVPQPGAQLRLTDVMGYFEQRPVKEALSWAVPFSPSGD